VFQHLLDVGVPALPEFLDGRAQEFVVLEVGRRP
jgi:hypothetical protein